MQKLDLTKIKHVHFIGIGGIGISAIARMMLEEGKIVSGQDLNDTGENIKLLKSLNAQITIGQQIDAIPAEVDLIVYSRAIEVFDKVFLLQLKSLPILSIVYPEMLGLVSKDKYTIAVSGCHGKTTTTGMIAHILMSLGADPTVVIGSFLQGFKSNFIQGKSKYFVVEADEYYRAFLNLHPNILIITNIDLDHVDYYKDLADIKSAYKELVEKVPPNGYIVCDADNLDIKDVIKNAKCEIIDYKTYLYERTLLIPGRHMQIDASMAYAVGILFGYEKENINEKLSNFQGTSRRFEYKGRLSSGALVYDDYAHHPTEIKASLQAFREKFPKNGTKDKYKLYVFFQPHLFSRTKVLFNEFVTSFIDADEVVILPIFKAREIDDGTISSSLLATEIAKAHPSVQALSFDQAKDYLSTLTLGSNDIIVTMGAGEAYKIGDNILSQ